MKRLCAPLLVCILLLVACSSPVTPPQLKPTPKQGSITSSGDAGLLHIEAGQTVGAPISSDLLGFSIELSQVCTVLHLDQQNPASYERLYRDLGEGVLRIGGHSADLGQWVPAGGASCAPAHTVVSETKDAIAVCKIDRVALAALILPPTSHIGGRVIGAGVKPH